MIWTRGSRRRRHHALRGAPRADRDRDGGQYPLARRRSPTATRARPIRRRRPISCAPATAPDHSADSTTVAVLVDSTAVSAPKGVTAATPTSAAPVLTWSAPAARSPSITTTSTATGCSSARRRARGATFTDATATEGTHDYAVLARDAAAQPGVLSASFKVVFDKTAPTSGGAPTAQVLASGQVNLVWPAAGDALSGVAGYIVRRTGGGVAPAAADAGSAVCTPAQPGCVGRLGRDGNLVVRRLRARRRGQRRADRNGHECHGRRQDTAARTDEADGDAPEVQEERQGPRVRAPLGQARRRRTSTASSSCSTSGAPPVGPADGKTVYHGLGSSDQVKLLAGQVGYFASTRSTTVATTRPSRCARRSRWHR